MMPILHILSFKPNCQSLKAIWQRRNRVCVEEAGEGNVMPIPSDVYPKYSSLRQHGEVQMLYIKNEWTFHFVPFEYTNVSAQNTE